MLLKLDPRAHSYQCFDCGTKVNGLAVVTNTGFEQIIGAICIVGIITLFASLLSARARNYHHVTLTDEIRKKTPTENQKQITR
jgi:hypothetical protein